MSIAEQVIKEIQALEGKKEKAIEELLSQRLEIDRQLQMLGHTRPARGRKPGSKNKQPSKASKGAASKASKKASQPAAE